MNLLAATGSTSNKRVGYENNKMLMSQTYDY
jgi:hypothetical protein